MQEVVKIVNTDLAIKSIDGQRVVTFSDIDKVHERGTETARFRFNDNKRRFIKDVDYFILKPADFQLCENHTIEGITKENVSNRGTTFVTESGYLMIVKSFTDDLAWKVQRELVNSYFKFKEVMEVMQPNENELALSNAKFMDAVNSIETCAAVFQSMIAYSTINYKQQQDLLQTARKRVNKLLGGAHSKEYKDKSRMYFKNLWQDFCENFHTGSYKDLNPIYMADDIAKKWISEWEYIEN